MYKKQPKAKLPESAIRGTWVTQAMVMSHETGRKREHLATVRHPTKEILLREAMFMRRRILTSDLTHFGSADTAH